MSTSIDFQVVAVPAETFGPLLAMSHDELRARRGRRMLVDRKPGFPCRVSLADAEVGEEVILVEYAHHDADSPYRASGPIFVRANAETAKPSVNELPEMLQFRMLSVRAYDAEGMMCRSEVVEGTELADHIRTVFAEGRVVYLHVHNAKPGCFNCRIERAPADRPPTDRYRTRPAE